MAVMFAATRLRPDVDDRLLLGASRPAALRVRFPGRECLDLVESCRSIRASGASFLRNHPFDCRKREQRRHEADHDAFFEGRANMNEFPVGCSKYRGKDQPRRTDDLPNRLHTQSPRCVFREEVE